MPITNISSGRAKIIHKDGLVFTKPSPIDNAAILEPLIKDCPYPTRQIHASDLKVDIFRSPEVMSVTNPDTDFVATIIGAQKWMNRFTKTISVVLILESPDLEAANLEYKDKYKSIYANGKYIPHITLVNDAPANARETRWWFNNLIDKFSPGGIYSNQKIRLFNQYVTDDIISVPKGANAVADMLYPELLEPLSALVR